MTTEHSSSKPSSAPSSSPLFCAEEIHFSSSVLPANSDDSKSANNDNNDNNNNNNNNVDGDDGEMTMATNNSDSTACHYHHPQNHHDQYHHQNQNQQNFYFVHKNRHPASPQNISLTIVQKGAVQQQQQQQQQQQMVKDECKNQQQQQQQNEPLQKRKQRSTPTDKKKIKTCVVCASQAPNRFSGYTISPENIEKYGTYFTDVNPNLAELKFGSLCNSCYMKWLRSGTHNFSGRYSNGGSKKNNSKKINNNNGNLESATSSSSSNGSSSSSSNINISSSSNNNEDGDKKEEGDVKPSTKRHNVPLEDRKCVACKKISGASKSTHSVNEHNISKFGTFFADNHPEIEKLEYGYLCSSCYNKWRYHGSNRSSEIKQCVVCKTAGEASMYLYAVNAQNVAKYGTFFTDEDPTLKELKFGSLCRWCYRKWAYYAKRGEKRSRTRKKKDDDETAEQKKTKKKKKKSQAEAEETVVATEQNGKEISKTSSSSTTTTTTTTTTTVKQETTSNITLDAAAALLQSLSGSPVTPVDDFVAEGSEETEEDTDDEKRLV